MGHDFTQEERAKGGRNSYAKNPDLGKIHARKLTHDSESQRARRYAQMQHEEGIANELRGLGWIVFSPTVVCDRVGIKEGKVYFLEFKRPGQSLRPAQQTIHDHVPHMYEIVYRD
ncbi:MAG TPA: hypothetical protein VEB67_01385 [Nitrososphaerales archaeon]|nr:hypothetical protein [Nitrososphaerales archaeon]